MSAAGQQRYDWMDQERRRAVPAVLYAPRCADAPAPLIVVSHGVGSSCEGYTYLGKALVDAGFAALHLTHVGSDHDTLRDDTGSRLSRITRVLDNPMHWVDRPRDVSFAVDELLGDRALSRQIDADRVAVVGHSLGAHTALALAGMTFDLPDQPAATFRDTRVRAIVAMSPQSVGKLGLHERSWETVETPALGMTGTRDIEIGVGSPDRRRMMFDLSGGSDQYFLTIDGASHHTFADPPNLRIATRRHNPAHPQWILNATIRFLRGYLDGDADAGAWLVGGGLRAESGGACVLEHKRSRFASSP